MWRKRNKQTTKHGVIGLKTSQKQCNEGWFTNSQKWLSLKKCQKGLKLDKYWPKIVIKHKKTGSRTPQKGYNQLQKIFQLR